MADTELRDRLEAALRAAAYSCDGSDCGETDDECQERHPVRRPEPWRHRVRIEGSPAGLADVALAVVQPELDERTAERDVYAEAIEQLSAEHQRLHAFVARFWDQHARFGVIGPDGTTEMGACADWCYACRLEEARMEAARRSAEAEQLREQLANAYRSAAEELDKVPHQPTSLTGPYWYGKGWDDAVHHLHDLADGYEPAPAKESQP